MPIYIVRWPNLSACLIRAYDEEDLIYRLDELGDPGGCHWKEYDGPLWIDLALPVTLEIDSKDDNRPVTTADLRVSLDGFENEPDRLDVEIPSAETAEEMADAIRRFAFPALQEALDTDPDIASEGSISPEKLKEALLKDLDPLIQDSWRAHSQPGAQKRPRG